MSTDRGHNEPIKSGIGDRSGGSPGTIPTQLYPVLWQPSSDVADASNLRSFARWLDEKYGLSFDSYLPMWTWSVEDPNQFWEAIWTYFDVKTSRPYHQIRSDDPMPGTRWFEGATLNLAEQIFRHRSDERPALYYASESDKNGVFHAMSWAELEEQVVAVQQFLIKHGIGKGDRVAGYLPNRPETTVIWLATIGLGAIWSCCSPDFGVKTVLERFSQIEPDVLFAIPHSEYGGKCHTREEEIEAIRLGLPSLKACVRMEEVSHQPETKHWVSWNELIQSGRSSGGAATVILEQMEASHPLWVLYSSGTTGKPKAIVHSHGGILAEHVKYLHLQNDVKPGEVFFWYTTTGWMMWNFLQGAMLVGGIPFLYDGSPAWPDLDRLWSYAEALPIHHFGTSAPWLSASAKRGGRPGDAFDLTRLRSIGSTGAPLTEEGFDWVYDSVGEHVWLCSMSGGTDVCTAFVGGCIWEPVRRELIQQRALGCNLAALDERGKPVYGSLGELAILSPMPSMPVGFWGDPEGKRYRESYFSSWPGVWIHGDWIRLFDNGSLVIQGRSDATLNRDGVRIGTAEIYSITQSVESVADSLIVFLEDSEDRSSGVLLLFLQVERGGDVVGDLVGDVVGQKRDDKGSGKGVDMEITTGVDTGADWEALAARVRSELRRQGSPRHVPDEVIPVGDIPYTLSGKKMEVPVKRILQGEDPADVLNRDAVRNPEAIDFFVQYAKSQLSRSASDHAIGSAES